MSDYSIKNQEKVLKILIRLCKKSPTPWLYCPKDFEDNFKFVSPDSLVNILAMLTAKEYIHVVYGDFPDSFNIETLQILPKGYDYAPQKALATKERWLERIYGFVVGTILGAIITYVIPLIISHIADISK